MKLCYAGNQNYFTGLLMTTLSAALVTSEPLEIYFLTGDFSDLNPSFKPITPEDVTFIESVLKIYNPETKIHLVDMTYGYGDELRTYKSYKTNFSPYTLLRLFIDQFIDGGRVLYIDVDTIVLRDLSELYNIDMQGNMVAMVLDAVGKNWVAADYCNAGVTLFDLDKIIGTKRMEWCRNRVRDHTIVMPDQSVINRMFRDSKLQVDRKFNEQQGIRDDTVIRHYCRVLKFFPTPHYIKAKPWDDIDYFHQDRKEYQCDHVIALARQYLEQRKNGQPEATIAVDSPSAAE